MYAIRKTETTDKRSNFDRGITGTEYVFSITHGRLYSIIGENVASGCIHNNCIFYRAGLVRYWCY